MTFFVSDFPRKAVCTRPFFFSGKFSGLDGFLPEKFSGFFQRFFPKLKNSAVLPSNFPDIFSRIVITFFNRIWTARVDQRDPKVI
jgi:hypothetical protein